MQRRLHRLCVVLDACRRPSWGRQTRRMRAACSSPISTSRQTVRSACANALVWKLSWVWFLGEASPLRVRVVLKSLEAKALTGGSSLVVLADPFKPPKVQFQTKLYHPNGEWHCSLR